MPKRKGMGTADMLLLVAFIFLILSVLIIFMAWNGVTTTASTSFIIWLFISREIGFAMLFLAVTGSLTMMMGILLLAVGVVLVLVNILMNR